jgi:Tol biopolymer transport system component/DNA-binding winged helix-turn-helix (wHTH) protein
MSNQEKHFYEFGPFRLDPVKRRLLRDGQPVPLTPKAFDTLLELVRQSGKTIEKDDLMKGVWPDAVVEENNLNQNISALRRSLGDSRQDSHYIATIPGLGYRFVAQVRVAAFSESDGREDDDAQKGLIAQERLEVVVDRQNEKPDSMPISREDPVPVRATVLKEENERVEPLLADPIIVSLKRHKSVAILLLLLIIIVAAGLSILVYRLVEPEHKPTETRGIEATSLTRTGTTGCAAISPDGKHIIYSVHEAGRESLWLRQVAAPSAQQIVPPAEVAYYAVTFSLDGNHIHFLRTERGGPGRALYRMPALGGVPTKLLTDIDSIVTLSPDSSLMAFVRNSAEESALIVANADGSNQRKLATRPITDYFKMPAWSPDGKLIACTSGSGEPYDVHNTVIGIRVDTGNQSPLTQQKWAYTHAVQWLGDGSGLLITARERHEDPDQVWQVSFPGGVARRLTSDSKMYRSISLTADSRTILAVQSELISDIWVGAGLKNDQLKKVTFATGSYSDACYTPDGRIVYASQASGNIDIWIMNSDGSNPKQLTVDAGVNLHVTVSPEGRYIFFASNRAGVFNIWRMDIDGSNPMRLTNGTGEKFPSCSPDGKWIVYNSVASDEHLYALWKVSTEGGEPLRLTDSNADVATISPNGQQLAYFHKTKNKYQIVVIPSAGGSSTIAVDVPATLDPTTTVRWSSDGRSLTYAAALNDVCNIWSQPLAGGEPKPLTDFKVEGRFMFEWSRDGKQLVFTRHLWTADLVLLKNVASQSF